MKKTIFGVLIFIACAVTAAADERASAPTMPTTPTEAVASNGDGATRADLGALTTTDGERLDPQIDAMLRRIEEQRLYLRTLDQLRAALEKEHSIAKLMRECEEFDVVCTGEGMRQIERVAPPRATQSVAPPRAAALPLSLFVAGVVADEVWIRYQGRDVSVRVGERIGGFVVRDVDLDAVTFERGGKRVRVPVERRAQEGE